MSDPFKDGYASAERHWKARWHAANDDHQKAVTEVERLRARLDAAEALSWELSPANGPRLRAALNGEQT